MTFDVGDAVITIDNAIVFDRWVEDEFSHVDDSQTMDITCFTIKKDCVGIVLNTYVCRTYAKVKVAFGDQVRWVDDRYVKKVTEQSTCHCGLMNTT